MRIFKLFNKEKLNMAMNSQHMNYVIWIRNGLTKFQVPDEFKNKPKYVASL